MLAPCARGMVHRVPEHRMHRNPHVRMHVHPHKLLKTCKMHNVFEETATLVNFCKHL